MRHLILPVLTVFSLSAQADEAWVTLFNGKDLTGWTPILREHEVGEDPEGYISIEDGTIHMYRDVPEGDAEVPFGVIMTDGSYSQFHLSFEYRWIGKRFHPRKEKLRDAGLLYHCFGTKKVWPNSIECQVQEGDTGDLVFLSTSALTWMHPDQQAAREGQGKAGLLPEEGGVLRTYPKGGYIGRFPENDKAQGWNTVEAIVHKNDYAYHKINDIVTSRLLDMRRPNGDVLGSGPIALQLEAAEVQYRNIKIRELSGYLKPSQYQLSFSQVGGLKSQPQSVTLVNTSAEALPVAPTLLGTHADFYEVSAESLDPLEPGESREFTIHLKSDLAEGTPSAGVQFGDDVTGCFVQLAALVRSAQDENQEPSLQSVLRSLGASIDIGSEELVHSTEEDQVGDSVVARAFSRVNWENFKITPVARYSQGGELAFGIYDISNGEQVELAKLKASSAQVADAHFCLMPPSTEVKELDSYPEKFGFYIKGSEHIARSAADLSEGAKLKHSARVYRASSFQGRRLESAYFIAFEGTGNGDYQDAVFLVEGVMIQ